MKTALEHLSEEKKEQLNILAEKIRQEFTVEMIILFGSYARGDWVEELSEDGYHYKYQSDFDILVVTANKMPEKQRKWDQLDDRLRRSSAIRTPLTLLRYDIGFLNARLSDGHYFYNEIKNEGIRLYDSERYTLSEPRKLTSQESKEKAVKYFEQWFDSANEFLIDYRNAFLRKSYVKAAFELHQATERFYSAALLVLTDYRPKTHDLKILGGLVSGRELKFLSIFPKGTETERKRFKLLRSAYVDARYKDNYAISREDLEWLVGRVELLKNLTENICKNKIASFLN